VYGWDDWDVVALAALVAGGAFGVGGLVGFLFGIPRSLAGIKTEDDKTQSGAYRANTNLEEISDWLTKILVGVGLVQFATFAQHFRELVDFMGPAFGSAPLGEVFAGATLAIFSTSGFLAFYLVTRIYLPGDLAYGDHATQVAVDLLTDAGSRAGASVDPAQIRKVAERARANVETRRARILWVDDTPDGNIRERAAMETLGMDVTTCLSTKDALTQLHSANFDVVISNFNRPHEQAAAYNLLEQMRAAPRNNATPFIIYTISVRPEYVVEAKKRGALGCTSRPQELLDLVNQAIEAVPLHSL